MMHSNRAQRAARTRKRLSLIAGVLVAGFAPGVVSLAMQGGAQSQDVAVSAPSSSKLKLDTGEEIYRAACVACHGPDGKGQPQRLAGFEPPPTFPDFTDCPTSTTEPDLQWRAIITHGGPVRAFSQIMPSFKDALTPEQIGKVIGHLRTLCTEKGWPRGNFNLPRPLVTEKAYPESEWVVSGAFNASGAPGGASEVVYERRFGASGMVELIVPYEYAHASGRTRSSFGDVALGYKHKVFDSLDQGSIFSLGGELIFPTGNRAFGTGGDSTVFEAYAAYGQLLPRESFFQMQTGVELPARPGRKAREYFWRAAIGKSVASQGGLGRRWSPMAELLAARELTGGARTHWDVVPQVQIPINKRMHIFANVGVRIPLNHTAGRSQQFLFYVLWDYGDGTLKDGWQK